MKLSRSGLDAFRTGMDRGMEDEVILWREAFLTGISGANLILRDLVSSTRFRNLRSTSSWVDEEQDEELSEWPSLTDSEFLVPLLMLAVGKEAFFIRSLSVISK